MQKVTKIRILVSNQRKSTKVIILENNSAIASPTDMITSCIKQPEKGYLGSSCVIWAQPFSLLCVRISLLVGIQRCWVHLCFLFAKESMFWLPLSAAHVLRAYVTCKNWVKYKMGVTVKSDYMTKRFFLKSKWLWICLLSKNVYCIVLFHQ